MFKIETYFLAKVDFKKIIVPVWANQKYLIILILLLVTCIVRSK